MRFVLLLPVLAGIAGAGCGEDERSLVITRFVAIDPQRGCVSDPASSSLVHGVLDVGIVIQAQTTRGYLVAPVVQNRLVAQEQSGSIAGRSSIQVSAIDVEILGGPRVTLPESQSRFRVPVASIVLEAGTDPLKGGDSAGVFAEVIPPSVAMQIAAQLEMGDVASRPIVIARVRPVGVRSGGNEIIGTSSDFPVELCYYCLTPGGAPPGCPVGGYDPGDVLAGGCFAQQDEGVTCCAPAEGPMLCGADVPLRRD